MKTISGENWVVQQLLPPKLRCFSPQSLAFYSTVTISLFLMLIGFYLATRQLIVGAGAVLSCMPYILIWGATAGGILASCIIWHAAGNPVTISEFDGGEDCEELAPVHLQRWTYQENRYKGWAIIVVACVWNTIGLTSLVLYALAGWPQSSIGLFVFIPFEMVGLIVIVFAIKICTSASKPTTS